MCKNLFSIMNPSPPISYPSPCTTCNLLSMLFCIFLYSEPRMIKILKRQWPSTKPHNVTPETMQNSNTSTLTKPLWEQLLNPLQMFLTLLSAHMHIFVLTTDILWKDSDKSILLASKYEAVRFSWSILWGDFPLWFSPKHQTSANKNGQGEIQTSAQ